MRLIHVKLILIISLFCFLFILLLPRVLQNRQICERSRGIFLNGVTEFHDCNVVSFSHKKLFPSNLTEASRLPMKCNHFL